jgi:hypothetical protein
MLILSLIAFTACEDFLDQQPISQISDQNFYKTQDDLETAIVGAYDRLQNVYLREFALTEMRSDNASSLRHEGNWAEFEYLNVGPTNIHIYTYWNACYAAIHVANTVLEHSDIIVDAELKTQIESEAKFIRALMHFNLVRLFGNIMWVDQVVPYQDAPDYPQTPAGDVYDHIIADLTDAVAGLPPKGEIMQGRATKGAAQALLANVYLTVKEYDEAAALLNSVITDGQYALEPEFSDVFYQERNDEILFAVEYLDDSDGNAEDFSREFTSDGTASGVNTPTGELVAGIFGAVDSATLADGGNDPERFFTTITFDARSNVSVGKFVSEDNTALSGNDWIVLRYADVLLMYAEAVLAGGISTDDAAAVAAYKEVLARAGHDVSGITSFTAAELLDQRRREFAFENKRWFDLERFGVLESTMTAFGAGEGGFTFTSKDLILPIPDAEIRVSNVLIQNQGY